MNTLTSGSFRLFRVAGIQVYLHWSWLLVAYIEIATRANRYSAVGWNVLEYVTLFAIVLLHEFGHSLACRQVGGIADRIMLWPLGGVAFVQPPPRPGALLWSIVAGPLVNVILVPVTIGAFYLADAADWWVDYPDAYRYVVSIAVINAVLLGFNLLPIYPLDGGQIVQALLWFVIGQARSLMVSGIIGLVAAAAFVVLAVVRLQDTWLAILAAFVAWQAWRGFQMGFMLQGLNATLGAMNQGQEALRAGRLAEADACFTRLIDDRAGQPVMSAVVRTNQSGATSPQPMLLALVHLQRSVVRRRLGDWQGASDDLHRALELSPDAAPVHNDLAWLLATCPVDELRNGHEALAHATLSCEATQWSNANSISTLAAAHAEAGDFDQAIQWQERANADPAFRDAIGEDVARERIRLYEQGQPYRMLRVQVGTS